MQTGSSSSVPGSPLTPLVVSRFVSTLAGSFRSFYLFKHDNKVFDEIMQNLSKRFDDVGRPEEPITLTVTSRSLLFKGEPVGFRDITVHLCAVLTALGFKEMVFRAPVHRTQFFQILHILSGKDGDEAKQEKLQNFVTDDESKPIRLVPRTSALFAARLPDEMIRARLAPLSTPASQGGTGFLERLARTSFDRLPDLYSWIDRAAEGLPKGTGVFVRNLADAAREGYFPVERFLALFPLPAGLRDTMMGRVRDGDEVRPRKAGPLAQRYLAGAKGRPPTDRSAWIDRLVAFSDGEVADRYRRKAEGNPVSAMGDLQLAESLLRDTGSNFLLGLRFLIRFLGEKNPVAAQDSAVKLAAAVWTRVQSGTDDARLLSLLSALRQHLVSYQNITLVIFPLREATLESTVFMDLLRYLLSLGKAVVPSLIQALDAEQDRGMRKKLCHLITLLARETGPEVLLESARDASPFLLRNLTMILGDIRSAAAVNTVAPLVTHQQRIVRIEAVRSLCKIGTPEATATVAAALPSLVDPESRQIALTHLVQQRASAAVQPIIKLAKDDKTDAATRKALYIAAAGIGGLAARQFLESTLNEGGFLGRFSGDQREIATLIKSLLEKMPK